MKKILVVVDYQKDFVDGSLGFPKAAALAEGICRKIRDYRDRGDEVVFTFDTHHADYANTQEGRKLPVSHCQKGSLGWQLYGCVASLLEPSSRIFEKPSFGSLELAAYLAANGYSQVELVGLVSNICVIANALLAKTALPEATIVVDAACTASFDDMLHEKALDVMAGLQMEIINR